MVNRVDRFFEISARGSSIAAEARGGVVTFIAMAYKSLTPFQQAFYFMPLQHAESLKIQERSIKIYEGLVSGVSDTQKATFATFAQFAELHHDIVKSFGRFPHRNKTLGRPNTPEEAEFLGAGASAFGQ